MIKTITITQFKREQIPTKSEQQLWRYTWQIKDEKHYFRQISARIFFNTATQTSTFQAEHVREMPLVDALLRHPVGAIFTIDFTDFNHKHCYDSRSPYPISADLPAEQTLLFPAKEKQQNLNIEMHGFI